ncbi:unnamed protein product [Closterium sp. NIES-65]|nr:unnamed protein product [Closterium sp. NIES-65]
MIYAAAPHLLWPFAMQYAVHQLNLWPRVSAPETLPTLRWTRENGDALVFRVRGCRAFDRDTSADKLSSRAVPCVFLGFVPDAPGWQFRCLAWFDESVPFYRLFPYRTAPLPPPPLFLTLDASLLDPLPPQGLAPSGVSQVDPVEPDEVAVDSGPARGTASRGAETGGAEPGGAETWGAEPRGVETGGAEPEVLRLAVLSQGELRLTVLHLVALPLHSSCVSGTLCVAASSVGLLELGVLPELELVVLRVLCRGCSLPPHSGCVSGTLNAVASGAALLALGCRLLEALVLLEVLEPLVQEVLAQAVLELLGLGVLLELELVLLELLVLELLELELLEVLLVLELELEVLELLGLQVELRPYSLPRHFLVLLPTLVRQEVLRSIVSLSLVLRQRPPAVPGTHQLTLRLSTAPQRVSPSPPASFLPALADLESDSLRAASPTVTRLLATAVSDPSFDSAATSALVAELDDFAAHCRLDHAVSLVAESESVSPPSVGGECALRTDVLEDWQKEFECFATDVLHLVSMQIAPEGDPDAPDIPAPRSYPEAIAGEYSSQWQSAMDAEMAS